MALVLKIYVNKLRINGQKERKEKTQKIRKKNRDTHTQQEDAQYGLVRL